jgi:hypothetical protein
MECFGAARLILEPPKATSRLGDRGGTWNFDYLCLFYSLSSIFYPEIGTELAGCQGLARIFHPAGVTQILNLSVSVQILVLSVNS